ncbi:MAG: potassium channel family protein [Gemmataceae bacterium]
MLWLGALLAITLILVILVDAFEVMILPRRVRHGWRLARLYYRSTWIVWRGAARLFPVGRWRLGFLSVFGPLSLFGLLAVWAMGLIFSFALLHWSIASPLSGPADSDGGFGAYAYFSGTTFFTLGYGDVVPRDPWGKALSVTEAGIGFGFLALVISYLPVLYQAFSRREITISLLDARAGSPPSAGELLRRLAVAGQGASAGPLLMEWERWAAELLESHLSFPVLSYYRSQHENQSSRAHDDPRYRAPHGEPRTGPIATRPA